jgi:hypothetical protein
LIFGLRLKEMRVARRSQIQEIDNQKSKIKNPISEALSWQREYLSVKSRT